MRNEKSKTLKQAWIALWLSFVCLQLKAPSPVPVASGRRQKCWRAEVEIMSLEIRTWRGSWDLIPFSLLFISHPGNSISHSPLIPCQEGSFNKVQRLWIETTETVSPTHSKVDYLVDFVIMIQRWVPHSWIISLPFVKPLFTRRSWPYWSTT